MKKLYAFFACIYLLPISAFALSIGPTIREENYRIQYQGSDSTVVFSMDVNGNIKKGAAWEQIKYGSLLFTAYDHNHLYDNLMSHRPLRRFL